MTNDILHFTQNKALKKIIKDSITYINILLEQTEEKKIEIYKEETYRVIILYVVAIIEAILLYVIKERKEKITQEKYKYPSELPKKIKHIDYQKEKLIIALQSKEIKKDQEIGIQDLVHFMEKNKLMKKETANGILKINNIRNTFHFNKSRIDIHLEIGKVEEALSLLHKIIKGAPKAIEKQ